MPEGSFKKMMLVTAAGVFKKVIFLPIATVTIFTTAGSFKNVTRDPIATVNIVSGHIAQVPAVNGH